MSKILIAGILPLEGSSSGDYCLDLAYWLHKQGYDIHILTTANPKTTIHENIRQGANFKEKYQPIKITDILFPAVGLKDFPSFTPHNLQGFKIYFRDMKMVNFKVYIDLLKESLRAILSSAASCPDLIICNHITPLSGLLAELFEELSIKIPVIQIAHNMALAAKYTINKDKEGREAFADEEVYDKLFVDLLEKGHEICSTTIAVSEEAFGGLKRAGFKDSEISKRFKGFDPETFKADCDEIDTWELVKLTERGIFQDKNDHLLTACCAEYRKNFGYDYLGGLHSLFSKSHIFVFAGRLSSTMQGEDEKGVDMLIDACVELQKTRNDFGVIVCGNGSNHNKLISKAYESGLDNMFFVGDQDHSTVIPLWNTFAVAGVYPSRVEPLGMVAIECAACGTPPITSNIGGFLDFVETVGGEVLEYSAQAFATAMNRAIEEDWKEQRSASFKKVAKYSWAKIAKEIDSKLIKPLL